MYGMMSDLDNPSSPEERRLQNPDHQPASHDAIIENFKRETKDTILALTSEAQETLKRAASFKGHGMPEWKLRQYIESEYTQKWTAEFGDWLPGTHLNFPKTSDMPMPEMVSSKPRK